MRSAAEIAKSVEQIRVAVDLLRGHLQGARHPAMPEACRQQLTGASVWLGSISVECNRIQATISVEGRSLMSELKQVPAENLELHPANLKPEPQEELQMWSPIQKQDGMVVSGHLRARMLASLDRVKDDTFNEEREAAE